MRRRNIGDPYVAREALFLTFTKSGMFHFRNRSPVSAPMCRGVVSEIISHFRCGLNSSLKSFGSFFLTLPIWSDFISLKQTIILFANYGAFLRIRNIHFADSIGGWTARHCAVGQRTWLRGRSFAYAIMRYAFGRRILLRRGFRFGTT